MNCRPIILASMLIGALGSFGLAQPPEPATSAAKPAVATQPGKESEIRSENREPNLPKLDQAQAQPPADQLLKIFDMQHLDAGSAAAMLQSIYEPSELTVVADQRLGDLVARGNPLVLQEVELLLRRLDQPGSASKPESSLAPKPVDQSTRPRDLSSSIQQLLEGLMATEAAAKADEAGTATIDSLRDQLRRVEAQAARTAKLLRLRAGSKRSYEAETNQLRQQVSQAFRLRQTLQRAQLHQFLHRLLQISQTIELREGIAPEIVERRMNELLDSPSVGSSDPSHELTMAVPGESQRKAATTIAETSTTQPQVQKRLPQFSFYFLNANGAQAIQWLNRTGNATSDRSGTLLNLPSEKRSEFRVSRFGGVNAVADVRAFASVDVRALDDRIASIVSLNTAELKLNEQDFEKLKSGEILTRIFWVPDDLTEAGKDLIMVTDNANDAVERGTVVATLRMATDAKKVLTDVATKKAP